MSKHQTPSRMSSLLLHLDNESKPCLIDAARLRRISVSDYVRTVAVPQARCELQAADEHIIAMTREEQLLFWNALIETPRLTPSQRRLGSVMRGNRR